MAVPRVSDAQTFDLLIQRNDRLQVAIRDLQEQIASGTRLVRPEQDPLAAASVVRLQSGIGALAQYDASTTFGNSVLGAQDQALQDATNLVDRAEQIATEQASDLEKSGRQAAIEEVNGLLQSMTTLANTEFAGRRIFGGLVLDAAPPFTDPNTPGYDPTTAYTGSTQPFSTKIGSGASERVRITTPGDQVFQDALVGLTALKTALETDGDVAGTLTGLAQGRQTLISERASVGARESQLIDRRAQVSGLTVRAQTSLSGLKDADLVAVVSQLTQAQTALQAVLASGAQIVQTSLVDLLKL